MLRRMLSRRVMTLPASGKVVVAHPVDLLAAASVAEREDCPFMLSKIVKQGAPCLLDIDQLGTYQADRP